MRKRASNMSSDYIKRAMQTMAKTGSYNQEYRDYIQLCVIELMFNRLKIDRQIISDTVQNMSMAELLIYIEKHLKSKSLKNKINIKVGQL